MLITYALGRIGCISTDRQVHVFFIQFFDERPFPSRKLFQPLEYLGLYITVVRSSIMLLSGDLIIDYVGVFGNPYKVLRGVLLPFFSLDLNLDIIVPTTSDWPFFLWMLLPRSGKAGVRGGTLCKSRHLPYFDDPRCFRSGY